MRDLKEIIKIAVGALEDKKGEDIKVLDISDISSLGDYFIIANGNNINQVQAMADQVLEVLAKEDIRPKQVEDIKTAVGFFWIIMSLLFIFLIMTADITMILKEYGVMDRLLNKSD